MKNCHIRRQNMEFVVIIDNKRRLCITSIQEIKDDVE